MRNIYSPSKISIHKQVKALIDCKICQGTSSLKITFIIARPLALIHHLTQGFKQNLYLLANTIVSKGFASANIARANI